jgi:hypothetical protein
VAGNMVSWAEAVCCLDVTARRFIPRHLYIFFDRVQKMRTGDIRILTISR